MTAISSAERLAAALVKIDAVIWRANRRAAIHEDPFLLDVAATLEDARTLLTGTGE